MQPLSPIQHSDAPNCLTIQPYDEAYETVIGDEKQTDFYPRIKIKTWNNAANLSVGVIDAQPQEGTVSTEGDIITWRKGGAAAVFYGLAPTPPAAPTSLRYIDLGVVDATQACAAYDLPWQADRWQPRIVTMRIRPSLMYFGLQTDTTIRRDAIDIPEARNGGLPGANPMYADEGLLIADLYHANLLPSHVKVWTEAVIAVLIRYGVTAYTKPGSGDRVYFEYQGREIKFSSPQSIYGHFAGYLNWDCNYDRIYDYYAGDVPPHDDATIGLKHVLPDADPMALLHEIIVAFADACQLTLDRTPLQAAEQEQLAALEVIHAQPAWIQQAERPDVDWHFRPLEELTEFEYVLDGKPASNRIDFSITTKGLDFIRQEPPADTRSHMPPYVVGSYAAYYQGDRPGTTGKAFQVYRPIIIDADGRKCWGVLDIDTAAGRLCVTVPQDFLDAASYPLIVDPTFGYGAIGATWCNNGIYGLFATPSQSGEVTGISVHAKGTALINAALYDSNSNTTFTMTNVTKLAQGTTAVTPPTDGGWVHIPFPPTPVVAGRYYVLAVYCASTYGSITSDSAPNVSIATDVSAYNSGSNLFPAVLTEGTTPYRNYRLSVYAHSGAKGNFMFFFE
jgi:hypothetical protein